MELRTVLASIFNAFPARAIGQDRGPIVKGVSLEAEQIAGGFRSLTWHSLIVYHPKWDPNLDSSAFLTYETFVKVLPSYLCAALIWEGVDKDVLVRELLGKSDARRYEYLRDTLSNEQRRAVREFLLFAAEDEDSVELGPAVQTDRQLVLSMIDLCWPAEESH